MSRVKLLSLLVAGLLLVNILLICFILLAPKHGPPHKMPREIIIERLEFSEEQVKAYDRLISWHRKEIENTDEQIIALKSQLYKSINGTKNESITDSLITEIGKLQMKIESIHYRHFQDIRSICTTQQLPQFDELLKDLAYIFSKPKKGPPPR